MNCACNLSAGNHILGLPDGLRPRFLSGLTDGQLASILSMAKHRRFHASTVVISQDDPADRMFLLASGHGRHFVMASDGRKILMHWLTAGQIFGGAAILAHSFEYLACTEVLSDSCALVWERKSLRKLISTFPVLLDNALSIAVTENIAWSTAAHVSLASDDAHGRVAHMLLSLASAIGEVTRAGVEVKVLNEDLAEGANVTSFTVSRCLGDWQRKGILAKRRGKILLRRPELLLAAGRNLRPLGY